MNRQHTSIVPLGMPACAEGLYDCLCSSTDWYSGEGIVFVIATGLYAFASTVEWVWWALMIQNTVILGACRVYLALLEDPDTMFDRALTWRLVLLLYALSTCGILVRQIALAETWSKALTDILGNLSSAATGISVVLVVTWARALGQDFVMGMSAPFVAASLVDAYFDNINEGWGLSCCTTRTARFACLIALGIMALGRPCLSEYKGPL